MADLTPTEAQRRTAEMWAHDWRKQNIGAVEIMWTNPDRGKTPGSLWVRITANGRAVDGANLDTDGKEI